MAAHRRRNRSATRMARSVWLSSRTTVRSGSGATDQTSGAGVNAIAARLGLAHAAADTNVDDRLCRPPPAPAAPITDW